MKARKTRSQWDEIRRAKRRRYVPFSKRLQERKGKDCPRKQKVNKSTQKHSNGEMERFLSPEQTGNVWRPNTIKHCFVTKHFAVWSCLMMFESHQTFDKNLEHCFVLVYDGRCHVRSNSRVSNMSDAGMRTTLAQLLQLIV